MPPMVIALNQFLGWSPGCHSNQSCVTFVKDFEEGQLVCDGVSIPVREFPDNTSEIAPIEHLLQDHLDRIKENDEDDNSFEDNFAAETLDGSHEARDIQAITDLCSHLTPEQ